MQNEKNALAKWVVKSENKILGPYSFDQIEDLIRKKQISIIDEVRDTETRWLYVRENPEFKSIVDSIRQEIDSKQEATKTVQTISKTEEISKTKTEIPVFLDDPSDTRETPRDIAVVREILENQKNEISNFYREESSKKDKVKLYGLENDKKIKSQVESSTNRFLVVVTSFFVLLILSTFGFYFFQKHTQTKQEEVWLQQVRKYKVLNLDAKAVEAYGKLNPENRKKVLPYIVELVPLLETAGLVQTKEIEQLKGSSELQLEQKAHVELVFFWSALQAQNNSLAQDYLARASSQYPASALVRENEALMNLRRGVFQKSYTQFDELMKVESNGRYLVGMAMAFNGLSSEEQMQKLAELSQKIEKYSLIFFDFRKELLLIQMHLATLEKNQSFFERSWERFVDTPTQFSKLFKTPSLLAPNAYDWRNLDHFSKFVKSHLPEDRQIIFEIHNMLESDQISAASQFLNANSSKIKDVAVQHQMNMLIFNYQNRQSDILALEKTKQLNMNSDLNHLVLALNKLEQNSQADVSTHVAYFDKEKLEFYRDWISLNQLRAQQNIDGLRNFTRNHFQTVGQFVPLLEAKSMVE